MSIRALSSDLHECDVVVGKDANVVIEPVVICYPLPLLFCLLSTMVTDVPQLVTQVLVKEEHP